MATKNLARTAIEGGRCGHYHREIAKAQSKERASLRAYLHDADHDGTPDPRRRPVRACFSDKLAPIERYLRAQAGRPWDKVRSDLFTRFDIRTTPGRHVLFDHVLKDVEGPINAWRPPDFVIDAHGILRVGQRIRRRRAQPEPFDTGAVQRWLGARKITYHGERFAWHGPLDKRANVHPYFSSFGKLDYVLHDDRGRPIREWNERLHAWGWRRQPVKWIPRGLLSPTEERFFRALPPSAVWAIVHAL